MNQIWHFTHGTIAHAHHGIYAFFTMIMFGSIYFIVPRALRKERPSTSLINLHFWAAAVGIAIYVVGMSIGGVIQGLQLNNPTEYPNFLDITRNTVPYLFARSLAGVLLFVGHMAFTVNFVWMVLRPRSETERSPTLFNTPPPLDRSAARS